MKHWAAVVFLCLAPALLTLPTLNDAYGNSEESLNAVIWGLGARNLVEKGWSASTRGALVSPHPGTKGDGIYAHHPPLPTLAMVVPVLLGGWEGWSRLLGLLCSVATLGLLYRLLGRFFEPRSALTALAAASLSVYALRYGRMLTTLTLAAPLFLALLDVVVTKRRWPAWALAVLAALVLSSWDGVIAGAALAALVLIRDRDARPSMLFAITLALVAWHLIDATHGIAELVWQFRWRAAGDELTWSQWLTKQAEWLPEGLGPLTLLTLFASPLLAKDREQRLALALLAVPGVVMMLVFRQGSQKHAYWGFNLILPGAFAIALVAARLPRLAPVLVGAQAVLTVFWATQRLSEERAQAQLGVLEQRELSGRSEVAVLARSNFHPGLSWYVRAKPLPARTVAELQALPQSDAPMLVDTVYAGELGCTLSATRRWQVLPMQRVLAACNQIADGHPSLR